MKKLIANRADLVSRLKEVNSFAAKGAALPILGHTLCRVKKDDAGGNPRIVLLSTNLEQYMESALPVMLDECEPGWSFTLNSAFALEIMSSMVGETVTIELDEVKNQITIVCEASSYTLLGKDPGEYPMPRSLEGQGVFTLDACLVREALKMVSFCMGAPALANMNGVYHIVDPSTNMLTVVATDTHRMAYRSVELPECEGDPWTGIVPARTISSLISMLPESPEPVLVQFGGHQIVFSWGERKLTSSIMNATFPDYTKIIPARDMREAQFFVVAADWRTCLKRVMVLARASGGSVEFWRNDDEVLVMRGQSSDFGTGYEYVELAQDCWLQDDPTSLTEPLAKYFVEDPGMKCNCKYLVECLGVLPGRTAIVTLNGAIKPMFIQTTIPSAADDGSAEDNYVADPMYGYVIMPQQRTAAC